MGANIYQKGIRNSSANFVNQVDSRNLLRSSEWPKVMPGGAGGVHAGVGGGQATARQCMAGYGWVG